jgi:hypothetical protein
MHLSNGSLIVIVIGDLIIGVIGAFIGDWLLPQLDIHLGAGMVALVVNRAGPDRLNRIPRRLSGLLPGLDLCNFARGA